MRDQPTVVYECPGCGKPVEPGDDYVVAYEYPLAGLGFSLHTMRDDHAAKAERRFHVEHFRGRLGDSFYELVSEHDSR
jgi:hypothetical protein